MDLDAHFQHLIKIYEAAPINNFYEPSMQLSEKNAQISIDTKNSMHHTFGFLHGSVYFKMLDDAAYFAAHTVEMEYFLLTVDFRIDFIRPFQSGRIVSQGTVEHVGRKDILARAELRADGKLLSTGVGRFTRSNWLLKDLSLYERVKT